MPCISWFADPITGGFLKAVAVTHSLILHGARLTTDTASPV
ncbi:hypothetical protein E2C01_088447 [Portunus trituberculatus]|uniref:Uncharacterized protein n=1 Tax=Portunus trituberculatus TaxID=210409 RepID=A0A5B7JLX2_PORTR|nr:hypothetical protein [Portunus trituberculatus]